jgi:thiamine-monophosphate kinase
LPVEFRFNGLVTREPEMRDGREHALIARLAELLDSGSRSESAATVGIGDDAAVTVPGGATATSVDAFVDGVHFRRDTAPPASIGAKALAAALSDLAAMGATPREAYVAVGLPEDAGEDECLELYSGLARVADETGTAVVGGDVTTAPALFLAITAVGRLSDPEAFVGRDGAAAGETVAVTGELGGAAAGLLLLERADLAGAVDADIAASLRARQLEPTARLAAGAALAAAGATAMIDVSDGLAADAAQLAAASGVGIELELEHLPIEAGVADVAEAAGLDPYDLALGGGEDYELLAVVPEPRVGEARRACSAAGVSLTPVGLTSAEGGVRIRATDGLRRPPPGFDHLRRRPSHGGPG